MKQPKTFWAQVRLTSITLGYSKNGKFNIYTIDEVVNCLKKNGLDTSHLVDSAGKTTPEGTLLVEYFEFRAESLHKNAEPNLMDREAARKEFENLQEKLKPSIVLPYNKQKGEKRHYAYLTGMVNMITAGILGNDKFDADPRQLTVITSNKKPLRTLARRVDGACSSIINPVAIWEIKEYYGTTTFGSRVADGVYETMLDGYELEELRLAEEIDVKHYLIVDGYFTWWACGKSYLSRMVDMVHEGLVDEVIFGRQVISRWPTIVGQWSENVTTSTVENREHLLQS